MKFRQLRLLADENISPKVVQFLHRQGIDVTDVKELGWQGEKDDILLGKAYQDQRFVLTYDSDFGTLAIHLGQSYYGVIYLRLRILRPDYVNGVIAKLLICDQEITSGSLVVVEDTRIRIRRPDIEFPEN